MSEFFTALVVFIAALNPPAVLATVAASTGAAGERRRLRPEIALAAFLIAAALLLGAAYGAGGLLDVLDLEPETFRISAGVILVASGIVFLLFGPLAYALPAGRHGALFPLAFPLLASPAALAAAVTNALEEGEAQSVAALLIVLAVAVAGVWALSTRAAAVPAALARFVGAALIVIAAGLIVEGIRAI